MNKVKFRDDLAEDNIEIPAFKNVSFTTKEVKKNLVEITPHEEFERHVSSEEFNGAKLLEYDEDDLHVERLHMSGYDIVILATGEKLVFYSIDLDYE